MVANMWKIVKKYSKRYFIDAMSYMALGLFASLLIGTIIGAIADIPFLGFLKNNLVINGVTYKEGIVGIIKSSYVYGAAIGVAMAYGLKKDPLVIFSSCATGAVGAICGGPVGAYLGGLFGMEIGGLVSKKTPVDIVVTPLCVVVIGCLCGRYLGVPVNSFMKALGAFIETASTYQPILSAIIISVVVGIVLTMPLSSAALCSMIGITGLAGGAATIGCCCQMVGFAIQSYKDNKISGVVSVGIGTSMLQFSNCLKKPIIWVPTILSSAILGPIGVCLLGIINDTPILCGMGTCGLTGLFGAYDAMVKTMPIVDTLLIILLICVLLPAVLTWVFDYILRKFKLIEDNDLKIISTDKK
ncbi:MAG: PTS sugar transporter subunit IIC [Bacilli bacterium]|nr:PTS sugar transporter subunit IIC [Bacilli bacterium]